MGQDKIETPSDFEAWRAANPPVTITTKNGPLAVPCMTTLLVRNALVRDNLYNPNTVSPDKMELLQQSITDNGVCFPIVTVWDPAEGMFVVVDGAHRRAMLGGDWLDADYVPIVVLPHDPTRRLAATWQFNKARGVHQVDLDADLIRRLLEQGITEEDVAQRLGIDLDTVHRYKQVTGVAELFRNADWSLAWEMDDDRRES